MKDNNDNNIDETLDNVNESTQEVETDALDGDGITEEEVDDTEVSEEDDDSDETHVTRFPADDNKSLGDKLAALSKKQLQSRQQQFQLLRQRKMYLLMNFSRLTKMYMLIYIFLEQR